MAHQRVAFLFGVYVVPMGLGGFFSLDGLALMAGLAVFTWQAWVIVMAERGRRTDLIKKAYKGRQPFQLALLVAYTDPQHLPDLQHLLRAIDQQEYPTSRLSIHLACTPETAADFENGLLNPNVRYWVLPPDINPSHTGPIRQWLIDRSLATHPADFLVMLQASDLIKPDFCSSVASYGYEFPVFQGYVGTRSSNLGGKQANISPMERLEAIHGRILNRVEQAGRFHAGLPCQLLGSGWAIRPDVLERVPYPASQSLDALAYTLQLSLSHIPVGWAPGMVVFQRNRLRLFGWLEQHWQNAWQRTLLLLKSASPLLGRSVAEGRFPDALEWCLLIAPPGWLISAVLVLLAISTTWQSGSIWGISHWGRPLVWWMLAAGWCSFQGLAMAVARCKWSDAVFSLWLTPWLMAASVVLTPLVWLNGWVKHVVLRQQANRGYRQQPTNRLNESLVPIQNVFDLPTSQSSVVDYLADQGQQVMDGTAIAQPSHNDPSSFQDASFTQAATIPTSQPTLPDDAPRLAPQLAEKTVWISNGSQQVDAVLQIHTLPPKSNDDEGKPRYRLTLNYRRVSFSTQRYKILDQAYYELHAKMKSKGLTIMTCGSCGYFYNPTADVSDRLKGSSGVCLFGKFGRQVDWETDAVTVVTDACNFHAEIGERESIVREWQESLSSPAPHAEHVTQY